MESEEYEVVIASGKSIMADNNIVNNQSTKNSIVKFNQSMTIINY